MHESFIKAVAKRLNRIIFAFRLVNTTTIHGRLMQSNSLSSDDESQPVYMTPEEIQDWKPSNKLPENEDFRKPLEIRMKKIEKWSKPQLA